ncbi:hypothetical protein GQ42DRAFT_161763, partial [Ramicandelaber brevisporus]
TTTTGDRTPRQNTPAPGDKEGTTQVLEGSLDENVVVVVCRRKRERRKLGQVRIGCLGADCL